jgi:uncharacterized protein DUF6789
MVAGLCGTLAHSGLMYFKSRTGLLAGFQPYASLQTTIRSLTGTNVPSIVPWALSFLNGMTVLGLMFGRLFRLLPGSNGAVKGLSFGVLAWAIMGLVFFPMIGLGLFATSIELGLAPAAFSLAMILTYSVVMGVIYAWLDR